MKNPRLCAKRSLITKQQNSRTPALRAAGKAISVTGTLVLERREAPIQRGGPVRHVISARDVEEARVGAGG